MENTQTENRDIQILLLTNSKHLKTVEFCKKISNEMKANCLIQQSIPKKSNATLILLDTQSLSFEDTYDQLRVSSQLDNQPDCVLINATSKQLNYKLVEWPHVVGVFDEALSPSEILTGLKKIQNGEFWLPRDVAKQLIKRLRKIPRQNRITPKDLKLTKREIQILNGLRDGLTNLAIANMLFVTEHTIKSHLYTTYQKLGVSTRLEASNWAMDNLDEFMK